jgi:hypothetical protein
VALENVNGVNPTVDFKMWGSVDSVRYIFGISGAVLSHSRYFMSKRFTVGLCVEMWNFSSK